MLQDGFLELFAAWSVRREDPRITDCCLADHDAVQMRFESFDIGILLDRSVSDDLAGRSATFLEFVGKASIRISRISLSHRPAVDADHIDVLARFDEKEHLCFPVLFIDADPGLEAERNSECSTQRAKYPQGSLLVL